MKAKSYSLADLDLLQKDLKQQSKERVRLEKEQATEQSRQNRMASEFLNAVKGVRPIKQKDRYVHPHSDSTELPEHIVKKRLQAAGESGKHDKKRDKNPRGERNSPQTQQRGAGQLSDQFDTRHLRDDEAQTYLRKGIPDSLLKKLQKGGWEVAARTDLHGKTVEEARIATSAFLYQAINDSARVVAVIHGQGFHSPKTESTDNPDHTGTLKAHVKNWLVQNPNVLAFCPAPRDAGGHGAVMVLLHQDKK